MSNFPYFTDSDFLVKYSNTLESEYKSSCYQSEINSEDLFACQSTLSTDSIINFDALCENDIDIDFLLNQDLEIHEEDTEVSPDRMYPIKNKRKSKHLSLLPYSIQDVTEVNGMFTMNSLNNEDLSKGKPGDRLYLSHEEKQLLLRDGHNIPTHLPLTKAEERALKSVRRKIRNKISAKNSRAKKESYVGGLEERIVQCSKENVTLKDRLTELENDKMSLLKQVGRLRAQLARFLADSPSGGTSLLLLVVTFTLILSPVLDPRRLLGAYQPDAGSKQIFPGRTRMLLESEESVQLSEPYMITIRAGSPLLHPPRTRAVPPRPRQSNTSASVVEAVILNKDL